MFSFWSFRDMLTQTDLKTDRIVKQRQLVQTTTIHCLPDEILVKIFNYLNFKDRCVSERVCKRFQSLCYYGVRNLIVSAHEEDKIFTFFNTCNVVVIPRVELFLYIIRKVGRFIENLKIYGFQLKKKWLPAHKRETQHFVEFVSEHCRNLKYLSIRKMKNLDEKSVSELLERIGNTLSGFSYDGLITKESYLLIIDKLNPDKLTDLTCLIDNSEVLNLVCDKYKKLKNLNMSFYKDVMLEHLDKLELEQCSITNHHLRATTLVGLFSSEFNHNLRFLGLECAQIDNSVVATLGKFKKLETLKIILSQQDDLDIICKSVPTLKRLVLSLTIYPNVNEIKSIKYLKNLRSLEIKCRVVQKLKFEKVIIPNLKHLNLSGASYFNEKLNNFHANLASIFPNLVTLRYKDTNQLNSSFFKMLDEMRKLRLLVVFLEQTSDLTKTINKLRSYSNTMSIDLILCKRKSELNSYFFSDIRPLHYLEPKRTYNLPKKQYCIDQ